jgi:hypothetical protein
VLKVAKSWTTAASTESSASATVYLRNVSAFGGDVALRSLNVNVAQEADGTPAVDVAVRSLVVGGARVDVSNGETVTVGEWLSVSAAVPTDPQDGLGGTIGLRLELLSEHGGMAAGTVILLGLAEVAPPKPPDTGGGGSGGGGSGGGGSGGPPGGGNSGGGSGGPPGGGNSGGGSGGPPGGGSGGGGGVPGPVTDPGGGNHGTQDPGATGGAPQPPSGSQGSGKRDPGKKQVPVPVFTHPTFLPPLGHGVRGAIVRAALDQVGWPYVWGGESRSEGGFDCSGLIDYAYAAAGRVLPGRPTAAVLWRMGLVIERSQLMPGDLVFLGAPSGNPYHVALYIGKGMVVVAPHRGATIGEVPLASVEWDGYARIWSPATGLMIGARERPWPMVSSRLLRDALAADQVAAARAMAPRNPGTGLAPKAAPARSVVPGRPRTPSKRGQTPVLADLRLRSDLRWNSGAHSTGRL